MRQSISYLSLTDVLVFSQQFIFHEMQYVRKGSKNTKNNSFIHSFVR